MHKQYDFILLVSLAAAAAPPALGQTVAPAVGPASSGTPGAPSIPDFSGMWAHPSLNALEQPLSGPGPVRNKSRLRTGPQAGVGNIAQLVGDYTNPILQPWAAEVVKKLGEISLAGKGYPTPRNQCWPEGVPFVLSNFGMQLLQRPDKITILYPFDHQFRQVRMNEPHPARVTPSWYGDSVGRYEGDELVIDTSRSDGIPCSTGLARRTLKPFTWWNGTGCLIMRARRKRWNGPQRSISKSPILIMDLDPIPPTRARGSRYKSRSRIKALSRCHGRRR
jgi:hypothetical protein